MRTTSILSNEQGALMIIISVMLLALLTIISVAASKTANTEIRIAANEYVYQRCFYNAEGAIMEVVDLLEGSANTLENPPPWMSLDEEDINDSTVFTFWQNSENKDGVVPQASVIDPHKTEYLGVHHGIPSGSSLDMSKPAKHIFSIYGRSKSKSLVMLKIGYAKIY
jgi:Tfp pilus assembly protein PilX